MIVCVMCLLTACEKHDGIDYFKSKCVAELNGQTYIDQTPFTISPDAIITPEFYYYDNSVRFLTMLRTNRGGDISYVVRINIFGSEADDVLSGEQTIEKVEIEQADGTPTEAEYARYCRDNRISYATVDGEIASKGTFTITAHDMEKGKYRGSFSLNFSEGTMTGEFE